MKAEDIMFLKLLYARYDKTTQKDFLSLINRWTDRIEVCFSDGQIEIKYYNYREHAYSMLLDNKTNKKNGIIELNRPCKSRYIKFIKLLTKYNKNFFKIRKIDHIDFWHDYVTIYTKHSRIELRTSEPPKFKIMKMVKKS